MFVKSFRAAALVNILKPHCNAWKVASWKKNKKQKESIFTPLQYMSFKALTKVSKKESMLVSNQQP
jgi:hypothetical protein